MTEHRPRVGFRVRLRPIRAAGTLTAWTVRPPDEERRRPDADRRTGDDLDPGIPVDRSVTRAGSPATRIRRPRDR
ncbi:hypothetical protein RHRU231_750176 [Rhodococcus ruber]|uniref:Uncharacterized protein n=1 Tax=Rhodococcus ruber TaxID=1830 RepID=A0A098BQ39_9NOCA|nr:hypothetical protein RHRU231_750176 [Rhodococcus ruber]